MIKFLAKIFFCLLIVNSLHAIQISRHSPRVSKAFETIQKLPEIKQLIAAIEKEGTVHVDVRDLPHEEFDAYWEGTERLIRINESRNEEFGTFLCSLLFELHNAHTNREIVRLGTLAYQGQLTKDQYVESVERLEYQNALQTSALLEKGISLKIFPESARWHLYNNFDDHYKAQQILGHSGWIANQYDSMGKGYVPYYGTIPQNLTPKEKQEMLRYMQIKTLLESPNQFQAREGFNLLVQEYARQGKNNRVLNLTLGKTKEFKALQANSMVNQG